MLLGEIYELQKPGIVHEDNQGDIFLAKNRQVGMCTKHTNIHHRFLRNMLEESYTDIKYIRSEENAVDVMTNNCSEADHIKYVKRITEGEIWELV